MLSKADLLSAKDLRRTERYLAEQLSANIRVVPPIVALSSLPAWEEQRRLFFKQNLAPFVEKASEHRAISLQKKVQSITDRILRALEGSVKQDESEGRATNAKVSDLRHAIHSQIAAFEVESAQQIDQLLAETAQLLNTATSEVAESLIEQEERTILFADVQARFLSLVQSRLSPLIQRASTMASEIDLLAQVSAANGGLTMKRENVRGAPLFEPSPIPGEFSISRLAPGWLLRQKLNTFVREVGKQRLTADLRDFVERLQVWLQTCLMELRATLTHTGDTGSPESRVSIDVSATISLANDIAALRTLLHDLEKEPTTVEGGAC